MYRLLSVWVLISSVLAQDFSKICKLPSEKGNCKEALPNWFHNSGSGKCEQFTFSGCNGNANRFGTKKDCERFCSDKLLMDDSFNITSIDPMAITLEEHDCYAPKNAGAACNGSDEAGFRWYWNADKFSCLSFKYNGCDGNSNNFESHKACTKRCQPMDGPVCLGGSENANTIGRNCQNVTCPDDSVCKMGAFYATCCNKTIENDSKCPDSSLIMQHVSSHFSLAESCDDLDCPVGFECTKGAMFARCCSTTKTGKPTSPPFS